MRFSLKGILDIQEARRHLYFSRKTSRKYIFSMSFLNLWVDFTKVLFEKKICTSDAAKSSLISNIKILQVPFDDKEFDMWVYNSERFGRKVASGTRK